MKIVAAASVIFSGIAVVVSVVAVALSTHTTAENGQWSAEQVCLNWAGHVLSETRNGVTPRQIDREAVLLSRAPRQIAVSATILDLCGTAEELLKARGGSHLRPARVLR